MGLLSGEMVTRLSSSICVPCMRALVIIGVMVSRSLNDSTVVCLQSMVFPDWTWVMQRLMNHRCPEDPADPEMIMSARWSLRRDWLLVSMAPDCCRACSLRISWRPLFLSTVGVSCAAELCTRSVMACAEAWLICTGSMGLTPMVCAVIVWKREKARSHKTCPISLPEVAAPWSLPTRWVALPIT